MSLFKPWHDPPTELPLGIRQLKSDRAGVRSSHQAPRHSEAATARALKLTPMLQAERRMPINRTTANVGVRPLGCARNTLILLTEEIDRRWARTARRLVTRSTGIVAASLCRGASRDAPVQCHFITQARSTRGNVPRDTEIGIQPCGREIVPSGASIQRGGYSAEAKVDAHAPGGTPNAD
jgi:hypothetical protein